ncbi:MAG: hypothetical protein RR035_01380, partial [Oscillibacter sp.]
GLLAIFEQNTAVFWSNGSKWIFASCFISKISKNRTNIKNMLAFYLTLWYYISALRTAFRPPVCVRFGLAGGMKMLEEKTKFLLEVLKPWQILMSFP